MIEKQERAAREWAPAGNKLPEEVSWFVIPLLMACATDSSQCLLEPQSSYIPIKSVHFLFSIISLFPCYSRSKPQYILSFFSCFSLISNQYDSFIFTMFFRHMLQQYLWFVQVLISQTLNFVTDILANNLLSSISYQFHFLEVMLWSLKTFTDTSPFRR